MAVTFENPVVRYGVSMVNAVVLAVIAFLLLEGTLRWIVLAFAVAEVIITPQFLKYAS